MANYEKLSQIIKPEEKAVLIGQSGPEDAFRRAEVEGLSDTAKISAMDRLVETGVIHPEDAREMMLEDIKLKKSRNKRAGLRY